MVRIVGVEPTRLPIRPSSVRVYQFHHIRNTYNIITYILFFSKYIGCIDNIKFVELQLKYDLKYTKSDV